MQQRIRSNMLVLNSNNAASTAADDSESVNARNAINRSDPNAAFTTAAIQASQAETASATQVSNLNTTILQGKIIHAILETAINSDLPGTLRAIVSRDTYAESGRTVMIPKGSRLIGTYNTGIARGQRRVLIIWTRMIRPDGLDIMIGSPGIDSLGRGGVEGIVDNKYTEMFSAAVLTSLVTIGTAAAGDALDSNGSTTTTTNANGTTTTGTTTGSAVQGGVSSLGNVGTQIVNSFLDLRPTITIDQGTQINVFVNRDLIFPSDIVDSSFIR